MNKTYTTILASCFYSLFFAQQTTIKIEGAKVDFNSSATNLPLQVSFDGSKHISENQFNEWMNNELIKNQEVSFLSIKKSYDKLGYSHNKLQQYYKGYKIEGAIILTHSINNEIKSFNGDWFNDIKLSN